jgi:hypothetical protein
MKKLIAVVLALVMVVSVGAVAFAGTNGNGAPSGQHFNLNIIGVDKDKSMGVIDSGHSIFVELYSSKQGRVGIETDIMLRAGTDFQVLDKNGTDGEASFQMPTDVATEYTVWARALGKPNGTANMTLCAQDPVSLEYVCNIGTILVRTNGQQQFKDVTKDLLWIDTVPIFATTYQNYFWAYDNNGLKLAQLRFYPVVD